MSLRAHIALAVVLTACGLSSAQNATETATFFRDVRGGNLDAVDVTLQALPAIVSARDDAGATPLHLAGSGDVATLLLDSGADVKATDTTYNASPLRWAAERGQRDVAKVLLERGAEEPDIFVAAALNDVERLTNLLAADPTLASAKTAANDILTAESPMSALHVAAYRGCSDAAKVLLAAGADVHDRGGWGNTEAIEKAAYAGHANVIRILAAAGADLEHRDAHNNNTSLYYAAAEGHVEATQALIDAGAKVEPEILPAVRGAMAKVPADSADRRRKFEQVIALLDKAHNPR